MDFGVWLRNNRNKHGLSTRQLAAACGVSQSYMSQVERGNIQKPGIDVLKKIMAYFEVEDPEELLKQYGFINDGDTIKIENIIDDDGAKRNELLEYLVREMNSMDFEQLEAIKLFYKYQDTFIKISKIEKSSIDLNAKTPMRTINEFIEFLFDKYVVKRAVKRADEPIVETEQIVDWKDNSKSKLDIQYYQIPNEKTKTIIINNEKEY
ncbi:helix-turn-helix transcriptional regulator [Paenibacillus lycopersici]|uniref:Helix-turn-helix transcriptional regulator n=1 Tax=Paenibacillus lycopersici TaxID=2704462 RepID=A0A6C0FTK2_9BACL|nr:helix-turn-helix transcriptional regulator [Paenibacillus lycopersici]QHT59342.1 helix-turn-helix transcriptional regulator [Paenibacillus lycopersici]